MSRQRRKQRRNAARRPWWRPLVGLGLLAGWLAVSKRGRQAVKAGKEQTAKASRKLAAARPGGTTTVAPPIGAPPGPVLAEVTKPPRTTAATASRDRRRPPRRRPRRRNRPPASSAAAPGPGRRGAAGTARVGWVWAARPGNDLGDAARHRLGVDAPTVCAVDATGDSEEPGRCPGRTRLAGSRRSAVMRYSRMARRFRCGPAVAPSGRLPAPDLVRRAPPPGSTVSARHAAPAWSCPSACWVGRSLATSHGR